MIYTLFYTCFCSCSDWTKFYTESSFLKKVFRKNSYPEYFKKFPDNTHLVKEKIPKVERNCFVLILPYLGIISLQARTKLQQALEGVLIYCKLEIVCKSHTNISNSLWFRDPNPKGLMPGVIYKFQCGLFNESYYGESIRHLDIRSGEHIGVPRFTVKKAKAISNSAVPDYLLHCN